LLKDQNSNEENQEPLPPTLAVVNELKPLNSSGCEMVSLEKYKLEVEQRVNIQ
jgi:hypothetical protein